MKIRNRCQAFAGLAAAGFGSAALGQSAEDYAALEARIATLEAERSDGIRIGDGTVLEIGGYVKTDFIFDVDEALGDLFAPESISIGNADDSSHFRAHARQSRFWLKTETPTSSGPVNTHLEFDLFGGGGNEVFSNSYTLRLRHAYASWNGILAGQTWSNFMPIESYPTTVDFNGPAGLPFVRQAQLRYTYDLTENLSIAASLENSEFSGRNAAGPISESTGAGIRAGLDGLPDFTLAARWHGERSFVKLAGVARELNSPVSGDSAFGWGVNLSGNTALWDGGKILASATYGEGVGRYLINGFGQDAFIDGAGNVTPIEAYGVGLGISHDLTETVTLGLAGGYYEVGDTFAADDTKALTTVHASLFWSPADRITIGAEAIYGRHEIVSGGFDDALRLQTSFRVNF